ncbi:helix-turn-helix domain-containing protein [Microbacterium foliorum]|uniref:Helix-turn-helix domain-containing protein n=1 Tax=Microbacterium foliorum TaxID=104336 RepID=A0A4Y5YU19_9MICO|nr:helix-turn-helix transcriptional regulator [Microbacterium foliorum]QDE35925.1 helix-turn-helix domain-containing protein [Microbacterium foliorum]
MATNELGLFLAARRAGISPDAAGIHWSGVRRVPGLRREEVAMLAGVSVDYYARLEQGREKGPSPSVLNALSRALDLTPDAREHLYRLAGAAPAPAPTPAIEHVDSPLLRLMDAWPDTPAFVLNRRLDILAMNPLAGALYSGFANPRNLARMVFAEPEGPAFFHDWDRSAQGSVANIRLALGYDAHDRATLALVEELRASSPRFSALWEKNEARGKTHDAKVFVHPVVGRLTLEFNAFDVRGATGQQLIVYRAEPGSPSDDALRLLATLAATRGATTDEVDARISR